MEVCFGRSLFVCLFVSYVPILVLGPLSKIFSHRLSYPFHSVQLCVSHTQTGVVYMLLLLYLRHLS